MNAGYIEVTQPDDKTQVISWWVDRLPSPAKKYNGGAFPRRIRLGCIHYAPGTGAIRRIAPILPVNLPDDLGAYYPAASGLALTSIPQTADRFVAEWMTLYPEATWHTILSANRSRTEALANFKRHFLDERRIAVADLSWREINGVYGVHRSLTYDLKAALVRIVEQF